VYEHLDRQGSVEASLPNTHPVIWTEKKTTCCGIAQFARLWKKNKDIKDIMVLTGL
jgi:hypothetical protein